VRGGDQVSAAAAGEARSRPGLGRFRAGFGPGPVRREVRIRRVL